MCTPAATPFLSTAAFLHAQRTCVKLNANWRKRCNREPVTPALVSDITVSHACNLALMQAAAGANGLCSRTGRVLVWESLFSGHACTPRGKRSKRQRRSDAKGGTLLCAVGLKVDWSAVVDKANSAEANDGIGIDAHISRYVGSTNSAVSHDMLASVRRFCMQWGATLHNAVGRDVNVRISRISLNIHKDQLSSCVNFAAQGFVLVGTEIGSYVVMTCFIDDVKAGQAEAREAIAAAET